MVFAISCSAGAKKRLRLLKMGNSDKGKKTKYDPNVVGLEESSEEDESESDEDDEPEIAENGHYKEQEINIPPESRKEIDQMDLTISKNPIALEKDKTSDEMRAIVSKQESKSNVSPPKQLKEEVNKPVLDHPTTHVELKRDPKIQVARLKLPILGEEQRIMELINENEFLIVAGETGKLILQIFMMISKFYTLKYACI